MKIESKISLRVLKIWKFQSYGQKDEILYFLMTKKFRSTGVDQSVDFRIYAENRVKIVYPISDLVIVETRFLFISIVLIFYYLIDP